MRSVFVVIFPCALIHHGVVTISNGAFIHYSGQLKRATFLKSEVAITSLMFQFVHHPKNRSTVLFAVSAGLLSGLVAVSTATRLKREEMLASLPDTSTLQRSPDSLVELVERSSLMVGKP